MKSGTTVSFYALRSIRIRIVVYYDICSGTVVSFSALWSQQESKAVVLEGRSQHYKSKTVVLEGRSQHYKSKTVVLEGRSQQDKSKAVVLEGRSRAVEVEEEQRSCVGRPVPSN